MHSDLAYVSQSALSTPTDDAIEAIIQQATAAKPSDSRPLRDTRTQLFVGNLPYRVRWQDLKDLFRKAGTVLRADVSLGPDNRSRGYGTVLLATAEDAGRAVDMFNGYSWQTRVLEVRLDRLLPEHDSPLYNSLASSTSSSSRSSPYPPLPSSSSASSQLGSAPSVLDEPEYMSIYRGTDPNSSRNLFVGNLPFHCQWQDLKDLFRQAGTVLRADVALGPDGRSRGFGTVVFATEYDAERAVKLFNGFEYNNRVLKVHYDKFSQASQPPTTAASPAVGTSASQNHPMQIKLPPGFMFDYGPVSGPTTPHEMYSNLQRQQQQQQQAQILHQPQAQHFQDHSLQLQQRQHQLLQSPYGAQTSKLDVDSLTSSLASTSLSKSPTTRLAHTQKPSPISATTSSGSTTTSSSLSDHSRTSTSLSSVSHSPIQPSSQQQQQQHAHAPFPQHQHQHQHQHHSHPNHPGPITLPPPLRQPGFPMSPHTPNASGISLSPLHHPGMISPYHMYPSAPPAAYQQHSHVGPVTPHGLPAITPSMPPFTFLPPSHVMMQQQQQQQQQGHAPSRRTSVAAGSAPPSGSASSSSTSASATADKQRQPNPPTGPQLPPQNPFAANQAQAFVLPLPSPGHYGGVPSQQPSPPIHHPHLRLNLSGIPTAFSPGGVSMSPGTFYGRQRDGLPMSNANPYINAAPGAPVHLHSPEGMPLPPGHAHPATAAAAMVAAAHAHAHGHAPPPPTPPRMSHGAYFYAMSGAKRGPPSGMEPKGYFDPMYFPVGSAGGGIGGSTLANEILQDRTVEGEGEEEGGADRGTGDSGDKDGDGDKEREKEGDSNTDSSDTAGGADSGREGNDSPPRRSTMPHASSRGEGEGKEEESKEGGATVLRARSVGYKSKVETAPPYPTARSDPNIRSVHAIADSDASPTKTTTTMKEGAGAGTADPPTRMPLNLPAAHPAWSRRTKTTGQIPEAVEKKKEEEEENTTVPATTALPSSSVSLPVPIPSSPSSLAPR